MARGWQLPISSAHERAYWEGKEYSKKKWNEATQDRMSKESSIEEVDQVSRRGKIGK